MVDRLISPTAAGEDDEPLQTALRPRTLDEFIGQDAQRRRLSIALQAARQRGEALEHLLLSGPPGLGKTTLAHIVRGSAGLLGVDLDEDAAEEIARRSRGTPRIANRLLRRVRDFAQVQHIEHVSAMLVNEALELEGVDESGLDDLDRRYLKTLIGHYQGRPAGVSALAAAMQQEMDTIEDVVEPYLLYEGFLLRTSNGRQATPKAYAHLRLRPPGQPSAQQLLPLGDADQPTSTT